MTHHGFGTLALFLLMALTLAQPAEVGVDASQETQVSSSADAVYSVAHSDSCGFCGKPISKLVRLTTASGEDPG